MYLFSAQYSRKMNNWISQAEKLRNHEVGHFQEKLFNIGQSKLLRVRMKSCKRTRIQLQ